MNKIIRAEPQSSQNCISNILNWDSFQQGQFTVKWSHDLLGTAHVLPRCVCGYFKFHSSLFVRVVCNCLAEQSLPNVHCWLSSSLQSKHLFKEKVCSVAAELHCEVCMCNCSFIASELSTKTLLSGLKPITLKFPEWLKTLYFRP